MGATPEYEVTAFNFGSFCGDRGRMWSGLNRKGGEQEKKERLRRRRESFCWKL